MIRRLLNFILLSILSLCHSGKVQASHSMGADITYQSIGNNQYIISLTFYRDCAGIPADNVADIVFNSSCYPAFTHRLHLIPGTGQEITPNCPSAPSTCNGGTFTGIQEYIYRDTVTLPPCADWNMHYDLCCRNAAINTIPTPSGTTIYVYAWLNNLNTPNDHSPVFANRPVPFVCVGQQFCFTHGAFDSDGDSVSYQLIRPRGTIFVNDTTGPRINYLPPYSANDPLATQSGMTFDPTTGDFCFTPTQQMVTVMAVLVSEYRNGVCIGQVERDIQVTAIPCTNIIPTASGINGSATNFNTTACVNQPVCFTINTGDVNSGQNVTIDWDYSIPGATFTSTAGSRPTATFCWTPPQSAVGLNCFSATVTDDACPYNGFQVYSYCINVLGPVVNAGPNVQLQCGGPTTTTLSGTVANVPPNGTTYQWSNGATTASTTVGPGTYILTATYGGCSSSDTVVVAPPPAPPTVAFAATTPCAGSAMQFTNGTSPMVNTNQYLWNFGNGDTSQVKNPNHTFPAAGTYTVTLTVTNASGCTASITQQVTVNPPPVPVLNPVSTCAGQAVSITAGGGTGYVWNPGGLTGSSVSVSPTQTQSYTVTVTNANGCTATGAVTATVNPRPTATTTTLPALCVGAANGSAAVTPAGGSSPYTYSWSNGSTGATATGLAAGSYQVTVTDANGCTVVVSAAVTNPTPVVPVATSLPADCNGASTGSVNATATGGTGPYTYSWSTGASGAAQSGLSAGSYTVTVTDNNGCTSTTSVSISQPSPVAAPASTTPVLCNGGASGTATVAPTGGTAPYAFSWSSGAATATVGSLTAGSYSVTVTDAHGCTRTATVNIAQPTPIVINTTTNLATCGVSNGSASAVATGGQGPYTYSWSPGGAGASLTNIPSGSYTVTATDANGCTLSVNASVANATGPVVTATVTANVLCYGGTGGSASVTVNSPNGPFTYAWPNGSTGPSASNLPAGTFPVTVTDSYGCIGVDTVVITQPTQLLPVITSVPVLCNGGQSGAAQVQVTGGTPVYSYSWSPSGGNASSASGLAAGNYTVTITDANGCTRTSTVAVSQPLPLVPSITMQPVACAGGANGSASVSVSGGTSGYSYAWSNGSTGSTASGLSAGSYSATVTDAAGCTISISTTVTAPLPIIPAATSTPALCGSTNGTVSASASGGTAPLHYNWSPGGATTQTLTSLASGSYTVTVSDANGCTASTTVTVANSGSPTITASPVNNVTCFGGSNGTATVQVVQSGNYNPPFTYNWNGSGTGTTANNLIAGTYNVSVTDSFGCVAVATVVITQPPVIVPVVSATPVSCNGGANGAVTASATGGSGAPYSYNWTRGGAAITNPSALSSGTYVVTVTDGNGCTASSNVTVSQPSAIIPTATHTNALCNGAANGTATISASGGVSGYTYLWSNGSTLAHPVGLPVGNYDVLITDANGCTTSSSVTVTQPTAVVLSPSSLPALCGFANGSATVVAQGGTPGYQYSWQPGGANTASISNITSGTYVVTVSDASGCISTSTVIVPNSGSPQIAAATLSAVTCNGGTNGSAAVQVLNGTGPFTINWQGLAVASDTVNNLPAGNYSVTVTDVNGCVSMDTVQINEPPLLNCSVSATAVSCNGGATGSVDAVALGGVAGYSYQWTPNGSNIRNPVGLTAGQYVVVVTDQNGCTATNTVTVTEPPPITLINSATAVTCYGGSNGFATVSASGGNGGFTYSWSPVSGSGPSANNLTAGLYTVTVTDSTGCTNQLQFAINEPAPMVATVANGSVSCNGASDGVLTAGITGGVGGFQYLWQPTGSTMATATGLSPGSYSVLVTDQNGCSTNASATVIDPAPIVLQVSGPPTLCIGQSGTIAAVVTGGTQPLTYSWSNGSADSIQLVSPGITSTFSVTVTDANGCTAAPQQVVVPVYPPLQVNVNTLSSICAGDSATILAAASGGNGGPYTYSWNNNAITTPSAVIHPQSDSSFFVVASDGCSPSVNGMVTIDVNPTPVANFTPQQIAGCAPVSVNFANIIGVPPGSTFAWNLDDNATSTNSSPAHTYSDPGYYDVSVIITSPQGCVGADTVQQAVQVYGNPTAAFQQSATTLTELSPVVNFTDMSTGAYGWFWNFGDGTTAFNVQNPSHQYVDTGTYQVSLVVVNQGGCLDTIYGVIRVEPQWAIYIPNAFTPNGDGFNDAFNAVGYNIIRYEMWIIDRWGREIYHAVDYEHPWNGTYYDNNRPCQNDVYEYVIDATGIDGRKKRYIGHVTLVR